MVDGIVPYKGSQRTHGHQRMRTDSPAQSGMDDIAKYGIAPMRTTARPIGHGTRSV